VLCPSASASASASANDIVPIDDLRACGGFEMCHGVSQCLNALLAYT